MESRIQESITKHIKDIEQWWDIKISSSSLNLSNMAEGLIASIKDDGSIPSDINNKKYRATTVASILEALSDADLLPIDARNILQDYLVWHQDMYKTPIEGDSDAYLEPNDEDRAAWARDEGASVWATSQAVTALLKSGYLSRPEASEEASGKSGKKKIQEAVEWLVSNQNKDTGGWRFQNNNSFVETVPITALALISLSMAYECKDQLAFSRVKDLISAIEKGKKFLLDSQEDGHFWVFSNGNFSMTASVWALKALKVATIDKNEYTSFIGEQCKFIIERILKELSSESYRNEDSWPFEVFFKSGVIKYKQGERDKASIESFVPYLLSELLHKDYKIDPLDKGVLSIISWIVENRNDAWKRNDAQYTYVAAMSLNVISKWLKLIMNKTYSPIVTTFFTKKDIGMCCENCGILPFKKQKERSRKFIWILLGVLCGILLTLGALVISGMENPLLVSSIAAGIFTVLGIGLKVFFRIRYDNKSIDEIIAEKIRGRR